MSYTPCKPIVREIGCNVLLKDGWLTDCAVLWKDCGDAHQPVTGRNKSQQAKIVLSSGPRVA